MQLFLQFFNLCCSKRSVRISSPPWCTLCLWGCNLCIMPEKIPFLVIAWEFPLLLVSKFSELPTAVPWFLSLAKDGNLKSIFNANFIKVWKKGTWLDEMNPKFVEFSHNLYDIDFFRLILYYINNKFLKVTSYKKKKEV